MPPDSGLPKRRASGYQITSIVLEVTAGKQLAERITREVQMPAPPATPLNEMQLAQFVSQLAPLAARALEILQGNEGERARSNYRVHQFERVQIRVLSGGRLVGRVNGARQTFNPRGNMTSPGDRLRVDTTPRVTPEPGPARTKKARKKGDPDKNGRKG